MGTPTVSHLPSKADLHKILDSIRFKEGPIVEVARDALESARKARRTFERHNKEWMRLYRAERQTEREMQKIRESEQERREREVSECRTLLRLYGVDQELVARIEILLYGEE
jgi:hypothetical protein